MVQGLGLARAWCPPSQLAQNLRSNLTAVAVHMEAPRARAAAAKLRPEPNSDATKDAVIDHTTAGSSAGFWNFRERRIAITH